MRCFSVFTAVLVALLALSIVGIAQASVLQNGISFMEDRDRESLFGNNGPIVAQNDFLLSVVEFPNLYFAGPTTNTQYFNGDGTTPMITAIGLIKVDTVTSSVPGGGAPATANFTFKQPTIAEWTTVLTAAGVSAADQVKMTPTNATGAMFLMYEDGPAGGVLTPHLDDTTSLDTGLNSVSDGTILFEFGFTGPVDGFGNVTAAADELFDTFTFDIGGADATNITLIDGLNGDGQFDLLKSYPGAPILSPHNYLGAVRTSPPAIPKFTALGPNFLQLQTNLDTSASGVWNIGTDSDAYISVIPEPLSAAVWLLLTTFGACCYRRRACLS